MEVNPTKYVYKDICILLSPLLAEGKKQRRAEQDAEGQLLSLLFGGVVELCHKPSGRPFLKNNTAEISISHTKGFIAVAKCDSEPIGIDIEHISDRVLRVREKFVSEAEMQLIEGTGYDEVLFCLLLWCSKEALFKKCDLEGVDFKEHFVLRKISGESLLFEVLRQDSKFKFVELRYWINKDFVLVAG